MLPRPLRATLLTLGASVFLPLAACEPSNPPEVYIPPPRTIRLLQTSDLHTNIFPWDYFTGTADAKRGLTKVATLVQKARAENPDCNLLIDTGDAIQGTPLGTYYALVDNAPKHPMAVAMNALKYDAMALGNHEFNYGLNVLNKFKGEVELPHPRRQRAQEHRWHRGLHSLPHQGRVWREGGHPRPRDAGRVHLGAPREHPRAALR